LSIQSPLDNAQKKQRDRELYKTYADNHEKTESPEVASYCNRILGWYIVSLLSYTKPGERYKSSQRSQSAELHTGVSFLKELACVNILTTDMSIKQSSMPKKRRSLVRV
jgi:hypothetical protein